MIQYYFQLQIKILGRKMSAFGLNPIVGFIGIPIVFIILSYLVFNKLVFSEFIYPIIPVYLILNHHNSYKTRFMKSYFSSQQNMQIRLWENLLISIPFAIFLVCKKQILIAFILLFVSILIAFINPKRRHQSNLPTPFSKRPFEFAIGFRKSLLLLIIAAALVIVAIQVNNFNFGIVILGFTFLIPLGYYSYVEPKFYVQIYNEKPSKFLIQKIKIGLLHILILTLPFSITLALFFPSYFAVILFVNALGFILMITSIIAKYSSFPNSISVADSILLAVSIMIPPLLFITIPQLYKKSLSKLRPFLE